MCGFGGVLRADGEPVPEPWLDEIDARIARRGPDGRGRFRDRVEIDGADGPRVVEIALVHRRLSVIDPSGGDQPMVSPQGRDEGEGLVANTFFRLVALGVAHLILFILLGRLKLRPEIAFVISFITVYNLRMLDMFRYGASLENYLGYLFLCAAMAFYYLKPSRVVGPTAVIASASGEGPFRVRIRE